LTRWSQRFRELHRLANRRLHELALPHHSAAAHEGPDRPARYTGTVIRGPAGARSNPTIGDGFAPFEIDPRQLGVVTRSTPPLPGDTVDASRPGAGEVDEARERQPPRVDVIEHNRNQCLHAGHAGMGLRIPMGLLLAGVRRMVGADGVDRALGKAAPDAIAM